jgi:hypothetical protein
MKILTIICNIVLLGLTCLGLLTNEIPQNVVFTFLLLLVPILKASPVNITTMKFYANMRFIKLLFL